MAFPNPPKTWAAGAVVTAAQMNAELRDALNDLPRYVAQVSSTSDQTGIGSSATDITFATASWTGVAGRLYKITLSVEALQVTSNGTQQLFISTGSSGAGTTLAIGGTSTIVATLAGTSTLVAFHTGTGALTAHARASTNAGTLTIANAAVKGWFVVEDIGPRP